MAEIIDAIVTYEHYLEKQIISKAEMEIFDNITVVLDYDKDKISMKMVDSTDVVEVQGDITVDKLATFIKLLSQLKKQLESEPVEDITG